MQTLRIELTDSTSMKVLKELEQKRLIRIVDEQAFNSQSLSGTPGSEEDFRKWIEYAENTPTFSLAEARQRWEAQKNRILLS